MDVDLFRRALLVAFSPTLVPAFVQHPVLDDSEADALEQFRDCLWSELSLHTVESFGRMAIYAFDEIELVYYCPAFLNAYLELISGSEVSFEREQNVFGLLCTLFEPPLDEAIGGSYTWIIASRLDESQRKVVAEIMEVAYSRMDDGDESIEWGREFWKSLLPSAVECMSEIDQNSLVEQIRRAFPAEGVPTFREHDDPDVEEAIKTFCAHSWIEATKKLPSSLATNYGFLPDDMAIYYLPTLMHLALGEDGDIQEAFLSRATYKPTEWSPSGYWTDLGSKSSRAMELAESLTEDQRRVVARVIKWLAENEGPAAFLPRCRALFALDTLWAKYLPPEGVESSK